MHKSTHIITNQHKHHTKAIQNLHEST